MGLIGLLRRKKKSVEEPIEEPQAKAPKGPELFVLVPVTAGAPTYRVNRFATGNDGTQFIDGSISPSERPGAHIFWALHEGPSSAATFDGGSGEALVLIRPARNEETTHIVSFVDVESAQSFARFEVKRGLDLSLLMIYWAAFAQVVETPFGLRLDPAEAPEYQRSSSLAETTPIVGTAHSPATNGEAPVAVEPPQATDEHESMEPSSGAPPMAEELEPSVMSEDEPDEVESVELAAEPPTIEAPQQFAEAEPVEPMASDDVSTPDDELTVGQVTEGTLTLNTPERERAPIGEDTQELDDPGIADAGPDGDEPAQSLSAEPGTELETDVEPEAASEFASESDEDDTSEIDDAGAETQKIIKVKRWDKRERDEPFETSEPETRPKSVTEGLDAHETSFDTPATQSALEEESREIELIEPADDPAAAESPQTTDEHESMEPSSSAPPMAEELGPLVMTEDEPDEVEAIELAAEPPAIEALEQFAEPEPVEPVADDQPKFEEAEPLLAETDEPDQVEAVELAAEPPAIEALEPFAEPEPVEPVADDQPKLEEAEPLLAETDEPDQVEAVELAAEPPAIDGPQQLAESELDEPLASDDVSTPNDELTVAQFTEETLALSTAEKPSAEAREDTDDQDDLVRAEAGSDEDELPQGLDAEAATELETDIEPEAASEFASESDEDADSDGYDAGEVQKILKVKRWEKRDRPFSGFDSPPGRF